MGRQLIFRDPQMDEIAKGILIGTAGTVVGGIILALFRPVREFIVEHFDENSIYAWLKESSSKDGGNTFRTTRAIASHCNLTEERVRSVCSKSRRIFLSTGKKGDLWSIHSRTSKGFFDQ